MSVTDGVPGGVALVGYLNLYRIGWEHRPHLGHFLPGIRYKLALRQEKLRQENLDFRPMGGQMPAGSVSRSLSTSSLSPPSAISAHAARACSAQRRASSASPPAADARASAS